MSKDKGRYLSELRRSNAAGIHSHLPSRSQSRRIAIAEGLDMPAFGEDNELGAQASDCEIPKEEIVVDTKPQDEEAVTPSLDELEGPTDEELKILEKALEADDFWIEDDRFVGGLDLEDYEFETEE